MQDHTTKKPKYLELLSALYCWSAKWDFEGQPSLFSATLSLSALNLINLITVVFISEALGASFDIPRAWAVVVPACLFLANAAYARAHFPLLPHSSSLLSWRARRAAKLYVATSVALFVAATAAFVWTGPSAA